MAIAPDIGCRIPRPDIAQLSEAVRVEFSKRLLGGAPVLPLSTEDILAFVMAGTVNLMHGMVSQALKETDPAFMCCDSLVVYAARHGINLLGATRAKGYVAITGDPNAAIPTSLRLIGLASREYKQDPAVTWNPVHLDAAGGAVVRVVSALPGNVFNLPTGSALTVGTSAPGIDIDATVVGNGLIGGSDAETCDQLRARVLAAESAGVLSTNQQWYIAQTMSYPGVTRACLDECEGCCDPTHLVVYPFFEGVYGDATTPPYGVPPQEVIDEMNHWMWGLNNGKGEGLAPVGAQGHYECATPVKINVVGHCFRGCDNIAVSNIVSALNAYIRDNYCVGSPICKEHIKSTIYRAVGEPCFAGVTFTFDPPQGIRRQDDAYIIVECGYLPVLGDVSVTEAEADPVPMPLRVLKRLQGPR